MVDDNDGGVFGGGGVLRMPKHPLINDIHAFGVSYLADAFCSGKIVMNQPSLSPSMFSLGAYDKNLQINWPPHLLCVRAYTNMHHKQWMWRPV